MRHLTGRILIAVVLATPSAQPPLPEQESAAEQPLPERQSFTWSCGWVVAPPETLAGWRDRADLVVHARIDSQSAFEHVRSETITDIVTAHEAAVLELFKAHPRSVGSAGAVQQVLQMGGRLRRRDAFETEIWNAFPPMSVGSEWVLFLKWDTPLNGFTLFFQEAGAVAIVDGKIARHRGSVHKEWHGRPVEHFLQALAR
jgi:hypothetical protein